MESVVIESLKHLITTVYVN